MKILTIIQRYHPVIGGSENLTKNLMDYLSQKHQVTVYTTTADDIQSFWYKNSKKTFENSNLNYEVKKYDFVIPTEIKHDSDLEKFPIASNHPGPFSSQLWNDLFLEKINFDLIFVTAYPYDHIFPVFAAAKKWNIPIIVMPLIHEEFPELFLTSLKLSILNNSNAIVVLSKSEKTLLMKNGISDKKISIIPPTLVTNEIQHLSSNKLKTEKLSDFKGKIVLFIGLKSTMKGIIHLIETMKIICNTRQDVLLLLVGPNTSDFENYISKLPSKYKNFIIDMGIINEEEKQNILSICDIFVLPSKSESFGLAYVEAWLHGKPVIGCTLNSVSEIIDNNKNGVLTEFGNIKELQKAILFLLDHPDECKKLGEQGKINALQYTSKNNLEKFEELCKKVTSSSSH